MPYLLFICEANIPELILVGNENVNIIDAKRELGGALWMTNPST